VCKNPLPQKTEQLLSFQTIAASPKASTFFNNNHPPQKKRKTLTNLHQYARIILPKHTQNGKIAMATTTAKPATP
jgi:hypothetical protein